MRTRGRPHSRSRRRRYRGWLESRQRCWSVRWTRCRVRRRPLSWKRSRGQGWWKSWRRRRLCSWHHRRPFCWVGSRCWCRFVSRLHRWLWSRIWCGHTTWHRGWLWSGTLRLVCSVSVSIGSSLVCWVRSRILGRRPEDRWTWSGFRRWQRSRHRCWSLGRIRSRTRSGNRSGVLLYNVVRCRWRTSGVHCWRRTLFWFVMTILRQRLVLRFVVVVCRRFVHWLFVVITPSGKIGLLFGTFLRFGSITMEIFKVCCGNQISLLIAILDITGTSTS